MSRITQFDFKPGRILARKYVITKKLGYGWEGEVYLTSELATGIERATKLFFPHRNVNNQTAKKYANKLHDLRTCSAIVQYHSYEIITYQNQNITCLVSEYVDGPLLCNYLNNGMGKYLHYYHALQITYEICKALETIHQTGDYHGDLHSSNIIVKHVGLNFQIKLIDCIDWGDSKRENMKKDIYDLLRLYYDMIGGKIVYHKLPKAVKGMLLGLRKSKVSEAFKNATSLKNYIENINWHE